VLRKIVIGALVLLAAYIVVVLIYLIAFVFVGGDADLR